MFEFSSRLGLALEPLHERAILGIGWQKHFEGDLAIQACVHSQVDCGHAALGDQGDNAILTYGSTD